MASPSDLLNADLNLTTLDGVVTSNAESVNDRLGQPKLTLKGFENRANAKIAGLGFTRIEGATFETGATVPDNSSLLLWAAADGGTGFYYYFSGEIPPGGKNVPPASTPASTGGTGDGGWLVIDDLEQRLASGAANVSSEAVKHAPSALNSITRTIRERFDSQKVHVLDFVPEPHRTAIKTGDYGAIADLEPISAAIDAAIVACGTGAYPVNRKTLWFDNGAYIVNRPVKFAGSYHVDGDRAYIIAGPAWTPFTATLQAGGTEQLSHLFIFLDGNLANLGGVYHWDTYVGSGLTLFGSDTAKSGVFIERQLYAEVNCRVEYVLEHGLDVGVYNWGLSQNKFTVENWGLDAVHFREFAAANGYSLVSPQFWGRFKQPRSGINFTDGSECNGVSISGGFIEKLDYGVLVGNTSGPMSINGVDFEQCQLNVIRAVGDMSAGRRIGEIKASNCFLHSIDSSKVYCENARVAVDGCRMFGASQDFQTANNINSSIDIGENSYETGTLNIGTGARIRSETLDGFGYEVSNYLPHKSATFVTGYAIKNYQYQDAPLLQSSGLSFSSFYVGGVTGQYVSYSDWFTTEFQFVTNPSAPNKTIGVRLANDAGQNAFQPILDDTTSCGGASARWSTVYAATGTINTSDERYKRSKGKITEAEKAIALEIKDSIYKFQFVDAVNLKGEKARIHFGVGAQTVKAIFEKHGLDGFEYAVLCYDEWEDLTVNVPEEKDNEGNVIKEAESKLLREAGDRYGIRYEQLCMFILAAL